MTVVVFVTGLYIVIARQNEERKAFWYLCCMGNSKSVHTKIILLKDHGPLFTIIEKEVRGRPLQEWTKLYTRIIVKCKGTMGGLKLEHAWAFKGMISVVILRGTEENNFGK